MSHEPTSGLIMLYSSKGGEGRVKKPMNHSLPRRAYVIHSNNSVRILQFFMNAFLSLGIRMITCLDLLAH